MHIDYMCTAVELKQCPSRCCKLDTSKGFLDWNRSAELALALLQSW